MTPARSDETADSTRKRGEKKKNSWRGVSGAASSREMLIHELDDKELLGVWRGYARHEMIRKFKIKQLFDVSAFGYRVCKWQPLLSGWSYLSNTRTCDGWWCFDVGHQPGSPFRLLEQMCFDIHLMHLFGGVFACEMLWSVEKSIRGGWLVNPM